MCNHKKVYFTDCEDCMDSIKEWYGEHPVELYFSWNEFIEKLIISGKVVKN